MAKVHVAAYPVLADAEARRARFSPGFFARALAEVLGREYGGRGAVVGGVRGGRARLKETPRIARC